jgi:hypothetical protein
MLCLAAKASAEFFPTEAIKLQADRRLGAILRALESLRSLHDDLR